MNSARTQVSLTAAEFTVLDNFIERLAKNLKEDSILDGKPIFESKAEMAVIWNLNCILEQSTQSMNLDDARKELISINFDCEK